LLFKHHSRWSESQKHRAEILFERFPKIKNAYNLSIKLGDIFKKVTNKEVAVKKLALWNNEVEKSGIESFRTVSRSIQIHYINILNFFNNRSTNASAESYNAKIKAFRATSRGVRDINFFLFRVANICA
jgi:transposase